MRVVTAAMDFLDKLCCCLVGSIGMLILAEVTVRYVLRLSVPGFEELSRLAFVWMVFLGAGPLMWREGHIRATLYQRLPSKARLAAELVTNALTLLVCAFMVVYGIRVALATSLDRTTSLGYPRNLFYIPVSVGGLLTGICVAVQGVKALTGGKSS